MKLLQPTSWFKQGTRCSNGARASNRGILLRGHIHLRARQVGSHNTTNRWQCAMRGSNQRIVKVAVLTYLTGICDTVGGAVLVCSRRGSRQRGRNVGHDGRGVGRQRRSAHLLPRLARRPAQRHPKARDDDMLRALDLRAADLLGSEVDEALGRGAATRDDAVGLAPAARLVADAGVAAGQDESGEVLQARCTAGTREQASDWSVGPAGSWDHGKALSGQAARQICAGLWGWQPAGTCAQCYSALACLSHAADQDHGRQKGAHITTLALDVLTRAGGVCRSSVARRHTWHTLFCLPSIMSRAHLLCRRPETATRGTACATYLLFRPLICQFCSRASEKATLPAGSTAAIAAAQRDWVSIPGSGRQGGTQSSCSPPATICFTRFLHATSCSYSWEAT